MVCKKDGSFFRCDYRALIAKTILDRHPILHVQDVLDREESRRESRRGEPTFDSFFFEIFGIMQMDQGTIRSYQCTGRVSIFYGELSI